MKNMDSVPSELAPITSIICPKCKSPNLRFTAQWMFDAPIAFYHNMSKAKFQRGDVKDYGIHWAKADIWCPECGFHSKTDFPLEKNPYDEGDNLLDKYDPEAVHENDE